MSLIYKIAEKGCFLLNRLPRGPKGSMSDLISGSDEIKLPRCMNSGLVMLVAGIVFYKILKTE